MAADQAHADDLAGEHLVICVGRLLLGGIESLGVREHVPSVEFVCHFAEITGYIRTMTCNSQSQKLK